MHIFYIEVTIRANIRPLVIGTFSVRNKQLRTFEDRHMNDDIQSI